MTRAATAEAASAGRRGVRRNSGHHRCCTHASARSLSVLALLLLSSIASLHGPSCGITFASAQASEPPGSQLRANIDARGRESARSDAVAPPVVAIATSPSPSPSLSKISTSTSSSSTPLPPVLLSSLFNAKPPMVNSTDAGLSREATAAAFSPGVEGYRSLMCGGALNTATLNCTAFPPSCGPPSTPYPSDLFSCPVVPGTELMTAAGSGSNQTGACLQLEAPPQDRNAGGPSGCFTCTGSISARLAADGLAAGRRPLRCLTTATAVVVGGWPRERPGGSPTSSGSAAGKKSKRNRRTDAGSSSSPLSSPTAGRSHYVHEDLDFSEGEDSLDDERTSGVDWRCVGDAAHLFYHMQSSGALTPADRARIGAWRGDTLLNDTTPAGTPLVGGFLDAADVSKFVFPLAYSLSVLAYGAFVGPARGAYAVDALRRDDLVSILTRGCDFLVASRYDAAGGIVAYTTAKGNLTQSHASFWGRAEDIDVPSDVGYLVPGKPSADLAGGVSAALSLCAFALGSAANVEVLVADDASTAATAADALPLSRLADGRRALDVAASYVSVAADLFQQAVDSPGLHTRHVDSMLPDFYNSTSYLDDVALAGASLALTTGGAMFMGYRRSNAKNASLSSSGAADAEGVAILTSGVSGAAAAQLRARADEISAARRTPPLRAPESYFATGRSYRRSWLKTPQAQTNTLSWDNVGPLAGNLMARTALASADGLISKVSVRDFGSDAKMTNFFTSPAQIAVMSWIATSKYAPSRILGNLAGFGDKVSYISQGGLAIAYENAWGNARLLSGATTLALDLADLATVLQKTSHRAAWRCWARSQARSLMGRLPERTTASNPDAATLATAAASALAPVGRARPPLWRSFVVGVGPGAPRFLSHRGASCPTDRALPCDCSSYASPYPNPTTVFGALVGGPNVVASRQSGSSSAPSSGFFGFFDSRESYQTNEPALDYNAGWLVTTMSLAAMDEAAPQPGTLAATTMSSATTPLPVSQNAANSDSFAWDSCFDSGLGTYPQLPRAFLADLRKATTSSIASSRYSPRGTGSLRRFQGWQPDGIMLMAAGIASVAAVLAVSSVAASGGLWSLFGGGVGTRQKEPTAAARAAAEAAAAKNGNNPAVAAAVLAAFAKPRTARQQWFDGAVRLAAARNDVRMLDLLERYATPGGIAGSGTSEAAVGEAPASSTAAALATSLTATRLCNGNVAASSAARKTASSKPGVVFDPNAALPDGFTALLAAAAAAVSSPSKASPRAQLQPLTLPTGSMRSFASSESLPESAAALAAKNRAAAAGTAAAPASVLVQRASSPKAAPLPLRPPPVAFSSSSSSVSGSLPLPSTAVEFLLSRGADPRAKKRDGWGDTALHYAAAAGNVAAAIALARAAPELLSTANFAGRTPAAVARFGWRDEVAAALDDLLEELGPIAELRAGTGSTKKARRARKAVSMARDKAAASVVAEALPDGSGGSGGGAGHPAAGATPAAAAATAAPSAPAAAAAASTAAGAAAKGAPGAAKACSLPPPPRQPAPLTRHELALVSRFANRGRDGWGSIGTRPARGIRRFRVAAALATVAWALYLTWRALRTLNDSSEAARYVYSVVFWLIEFFGFVFWCPLVVCLWRQVERPPRNLHRMLYGDKGLTRDSASTMVSSSAYPSVALIIACYVEPVEIIQPTIVAALQQDYPPDRVHVCVCCDDPRRLDVPTMVETVRSAFTRYWGANNFPRLSFLARPKVPGVGHHAKAGNINSALFASGVSEDFVVVIDCDMLTDPKFLARTLGHFMESEPAGDGQAPHGNSDGQVFAGESDVAMRNAEEVTATATTAASTATSPAAAIITTDVNSPLTSSSPSRPPPPPPRGAWRLKPRTGFLQVPQAFVNISASDPLCHRSRLFFGPLQAGRDGADAVCCCGTGCVFERAALVSIGGQAYGSITEDNLTSQALAAAGFSSIYLDENLQAGLAPDDVPGVFEQRLRWATGALQILVRANPLSRPGLGFVQRLLYFDASAYALQSPATLVLILVPLVFLFTGITPFAVREMWELLIAFGLFYVAQRIALWIAHLRIEGGTIGSGVAGSEMLRTTQIGYWLAPNNTRAVLTVLWHELKRALTPKGTKVEDLVFKVTKKGGGASTGSATPSAAGEGSGRGAAGTPSAAATPDKAPAGAGAATTASGASAAKVVNFSLAGDAALRAAFSSEASSFEPAAPGKGASEPMPPKQQLLGGSGTAAAAAPANVTGTFDRLKAVLASPSVAGFKAATAAREALPYLWVHWLYFFAVLAAAVYVVVLAATGKLDDWGYAVTAIALGWSALICSQLWPPVSILLPEHLRNFMQLVVNLSTCSCIFRRGRGSGKAAKRVRKRQRQRARERMQRYYASSGESSIESKYDKGDDDDTSDDSDGGSNDDDASYGKSGSGRIGRRNDDSLKTNRSFLDDGTVFGSVAPGREARRGARSGTRAGLPNAGGSWGDISCAASGGAAAAAPAGPPADEENAASTAVGASSRGGGGGGGSGSTLSRRLSLAGEAKTVATLLVPTPASFAIWVIDLFVVGALIAAAIIDAERAEIVLHKVPSQ